MEQLDVAIVGGGPAAMGAARRLAEHGIAKLAVFEREAEAGGIPRHCGHPGFGWQSHYRLWPGPRFAAELRREASGLDVRTGTTVREVHGDGRLVIRDRHGQHDVQAKRILVATGTRESSRAARLIGGARPQGVMNTGTLQQHVYLHNHRPFERPVIIGAEWVSYSAILTCRHLGIRPVAMVAEHGDETTPAVVALAARLWFGIPLWRDVSGLSIEGRRTVDAVTFRSGGEEQRIACDGVIVSGRFRPEDALVVKSPNVFTAGNVTAPLKTSGRCWLAGRAAADRIVESLA